MPVSKKPRRPKQAARAIPVQRDPLEAARRFWCGRAPVGADQFIAPTGTVAITFDVEGVDPSTCMIDASKLTEVLAEVEKEAKKHDYYAMVRTVAREFVRARGKHDDGAFQWLGLLALWTAFNHPKTTQMRSAVAAVMRRDEVPHITWNYGPNGFCTALSNRFVDLAAIAKAAPKDSMFVYRPDDTGSVQH